MVAVFGAAVAQGFWWWNSTVDVEGVELRSIWEVTDGGDSAYLYEGEVVITVPSEAKAVLVGAASNETVTIKTRNTLNKGSEGFSGGYWGSFAEILRPPGLFSQMCRPLISLRRGRCNL